MIVDDRCALSHAHIIYGSKRCSTYIVRDRKRLHSFSYDMGKYARNTQLYDSGEIRLDTFRLLNVYNRILSLTNLGTVDLV